MEALQLVWHPGIPSPEHLEAVFRHNCGNVAVHRHCTTCEFPLTSSPHAQSSPSANPKEFVSFISPPVTHKSEYFAVTMSSAVVFDFGNSKFF